MKSYLQEKIKNLVTWKNAKICSCILVLFCSTYHGYFYHSLEKICYRDLLGRQHSLGQSQPVEYSSQSEKDGSCQLKLYHNNPAIGGQTECSPNSNSPQTKKIVLFGGSAMEKMAKHIKNTFADKRSNNSDRAPEVQVEHIKMSSMNINIKKKIQYYKSLGQNGPDIVVIGTSYDPNVLDLDIYDHKMISKAAQDISDMSLDLNILAHQALTFWMFTREAPSSPIVMGRKSEKEQVYETEIIEALSGSHVRIWDASILSFSSFDSLHQYQAEVFMNLLCNKNQMKDRNLNLCCSSYKETNYEAIFLIVGVLITCGLVLLAIFCLDWSSICNSLYSKLNCKIVAGLTESKMAKKFPKVFYSIIGRKTPPPSESVESGISSEEVESLTTPPAASTKEIKSSTSSRDGLTDILKLLFKGVLIFSYFYVCDRTDLFPKGDKHYSLLEFAMPVLVAIIFAFLMQDKSQTDKILNREITDEWKGWMQVIILIYHMTGASAILPIYMHIRILVSSYLFMTGFGNFCYYWTGGAMNFYRYCQVMIRMNLLTIILCLVMQKPYQFYYFVPLVSFWFTVIYLILLLPPNLTKNTESVKYILVSQDVIVVLVKFAVFFVIISALSFSRTIFDAIFTFPVWSFLFEIPGHTDYEWWFRWQIDRYSILYGSMCGLVYQLFFVTSSSNLQLKETSNGLETKEVKKSYLSHYLILTFVGLVFVVSYSMIFLFCSSKASCNILHPCIVFIPIIGYIILRDLSPQVRHYHSKVMFAAGKLSLELFICQYHIWLAADTKGKLILVPGYPCLNLMATTLIFVCVAHEVNNLTGHFAKAIIPKDNNKIIRNLTIFFILVFAFSLIL